MFALNAMSDRTDNFKQRKEENTKKSINHGKKITIYLANAKKHFPNQILRN